MSVDECFMPFVVTLDLEDVGKRDRPVRLDDVLDSGCPLVAFALEGFLSSLGGSTKANCRFRVGDFGLTGNELWVNWIYVALLTGGGVDERRAKRNGFAIFESDVGYGIGDWDVILEQ